MTTLHKSQCGMVTIATNGQFYYVGRFNQETGKYKPTQKTSFRRIAEYYFGLVVDEIATSAPKQLALF